jgi:uroporphyrinogen III methyltransferase/synthase
MPNGRSSFIILTSSFVLRSRKRVEFDRDAVSQPAGVAAEDPAEGVPAAKHPFAGEEDGQVFALFQWAIADGREAPERQVAKRQAHAGHLPRVDRVIQPVSLNGGVNLFAGEHPPIGPRFGRQTGGHAKQGNHSDAPFTNLKAIRTRIFHSPANFRSVDGHTLLRQHRVSSRLIGQKRGKGYLASRGIGGRVRLSEPPGIVFLVGAGPGDPGLITVRGGKLLEQADVVVYDYLSNPRLLSHCPQAEAIYVGKKAAAHSMPQEQINSLLIEQARLGKKVVRLKGGDPFVFGRGGEECQALAEAGIRFEIVPGVTAAIAAPAYAGIPVTHRDFNSSFTVVTGHERDDGEPAGDIQWDVIAKLPCVAFYMGVKSLPRICQKLMESGMAPQTPAATIQWGTMPAQRTVVSTLSTLPADVAAAKLGAPAISIFGRVVEMRAAISWAEKRPLFGQTILVTRSRHQASELSQKLEDLGSAVIEAPTIELRPPENMQPVDAALASAGTFDWVCFTSANGVAAAKKRLLEIGKDARAFGTAKIAAIGDATAEAIQRELCLNVDACPREFVAEALADELRERQEVSGRRFLLLRADIARPLLRDRLVAGGAAEVKDVAIYETHPARQLPAGAIQALESGSIRWITFTSSSTVTNFLQLLGPDFRGKLASVKLASIGPITSKTLRDAGLEPAVQAKNFNIDGLVEAILGLK